MDKETQFKEIVEARGDGKMVSLSSHPLPGEYVITSIQAGNLRGERGWGFYIGYVVQVRKQAGAFGSDMILLRHPDGTLMRHENQSFYRMRPDWEEKAKALFNEGITPEMEDYTQPYTLGNGEYPETGAIIEPNNNGPEPDNSPMASITITHGDGSKTVEVC